MNCKKILEVNFSAHLDSKYDKSKIHIHCTARRVLGSNKLGYSPRILSIREIPAAYKVEK